MGQIEILNCFMDIKFFSSQIPSREIDKDEGRLWTEWNKDTKQVRTYSACNYYGRRYHMKVKLHVSMNCNTL